jgi:hypothetical protein
MNTSQRKRQPEPPRTQLNGQATTRLDPAANWFTHVLQGAQWTDANIQRMRSTSKVMRNRINADATRGLPQDAVIWSLNRSEMRKEYLNEAGVDTSQNMWHTSVRRAWMQSQPRHPPFIHPIPTARSHFLKVPVKDHDSFISSYDENNKKFDLVRNWYTQYKAHLLKMTPNGSTLPQPGDSVRVGWHKLRDLRYSDWYPKRWYMVGPAPDYNLISAEDSGFLPIFANPEVSFVPRVVGTFVSIPSPSYFASQSAPILIAIPKHFVRQLCDSFQANQKTCILTAKETTHAPDIQKTYCALLPANEAMSKKATAFFRTED